MERNQKINCTVTSCKYNNTENAECILKAIHVLLYNIKHPCI